MSDNKSDFPMVPNRKHEPKSQPKIFIRPSAKNISSVSRHVMLNPGLKRYVVVNKGLAKKKPVILENTLINPPQPLNRSTSTENDAKCIQLSPPKHNPETVIKNTTSKHASKLSNLPSATKTQGSTTPSSSSQSSPMNFSKPMKVLQPNEAKTRKTLNINYKPALNRRCFTAECTTADGRMEIRTADEFVKMIGEMQFDVLMSALLSVRNEDLRNRAILSFLTPKNNSRPSRMDVATQTVDVPQTERTPRVKRRQIRKRQQPYALEEHSKSVIIKKKIIDPFSYSDVVDFCKPEEKGTPSEENALDFDNINDSFDIISHVSLPSNISVPISLINKSDSVIEKCFEKFIATDHETDAKSIKYCKVSNENVINRGQKGASPRTETENQKNLISDFELSQKGPSTQNSSSNLDDTLVLNSNQATHKTMSTLALLNSNVNKTVDTSILNCNVASESINLGNSYKNNDGKDRTPFNIDTATYTGLLEDLEPAERELLRAVNPEDWFHLATPARLAVLSLEDRKRIVELQMYIDMKFSLITDEDNYLPIHNAVLNNDEDLLRRQCYILKANQQSVDIGDAEFNLSALQMCIKHRSPLRLAKVLLDLGACPLGLDDDDRSSIHLAAEVPQHEYLETVLELMAANPREYLQLAELEIDDSVERDKKALIDILLSHAVNAFDSRGYTPLMVAADLGHCEHVMLLLEQLIDPSPTVNRQSLTSKDTALHLAVVGACKQAERNGDMSKVPDNYIKTISHLIRYGADLWIENKYGATVNSIVCEFRFQALFKLVNTALGEPKFRNINTEITVTDDNSKVIENVSFSGIEPFIIVKKENGTFDYCKPKDHLRRKSDRKDKDKEEKDKRKRKKSEKTSGQGIVFLGVEDVNKGPNKINVKMPDDVTLSHLNEKKPKLVAITKSKIGKLKVETKKESPNEHNPNSTMNLNLVNSNKTTTTNEIIASFQNKNIPSTSTAPLNSKIAILKSSPSKSTDFFKSLDIKPMKVKVLSVIGPKGEVDRKVTTPENINTKNITISTAQNATTKVLDTVTASNSFTKSINILKRRTSFPNRNRTDTSASTSTDLKKS